MDTERAQAMVDEFLKLLDAHRAAESAGFNTTGRMSPIDVLEAKRQAAEFDDEIQRRLPGIARLAHEVTPGNTQIRRQAGSGWRWRFVRSGALLLQGALRDQAEVESIIGPTGPQLAARSLHEGVWGAATRLWDGGNYREAVQRAATFLDEHLQLKLGRSHPSGQDLVAQAFRLEPPQRGEPRLRFREFNVDTDDYRSAHMGAMSFGRGCFLRIRNLVTHRTEELDPQLALEQLAALSLFARWVDGADVERHPDDKL